MILLLAGTSEAREIAATLSAREMVHIASLAGATRAPKTDGGTWRVGGFGGEAGFRDFLKCEAISAVIDATHPFAARISERTFRVCADLGLRHIQLMRPAWEPAEGDTWFPVVNELEAAALVEPQETVFLATGRQTLDQFESLVAKHIYCRQIDPPTRPFPFENGEYVIGRPPFSVDEEIALFRKLDVDWLVVKNAGGDASRSKLDAARALRLRVAMIERPPALACEVVSSVAKVLNWVENLK